MLGFSFASPANWTNERVNYQCLKKSDQRSDIRDDAVWEPFTQKCGNLVTIPKHIGSLEFNWSQTLHPIKLGIN